MGQRFQILIKENNKIKDIYHSQWLWGKFAIRRIGTAIRYYNKQNWINNNFEDFLKASFHRLKDMNRCYNYFENYKDLKKYIKDKNNNIISIMQGLDNNDGYCIIYIDNHKVIGYGFYSNGLKPLNVEEYLKSKTWYDEEQNKTQEKELKTNLKMFKKLEYIKEVE